MANPARPAAKSVAELIAGSLDPLVRKRGLARAELISWWPDIVGPVYAGRTVPERIKWARDGRAATLVVRCDPSLALQFSYEIDGVRERLNTYFGYSAIGAVRIVQHRIGTEGEKPPERELGGEIPAQLETRLEAVGGPLSESLRKLGRHVLAGSA